MGTAEQPIGTISKDPDAIRTYAINFEDWLNSIPISGETISSYILTVPSGITKVSDSNTATKVLVKLSGGTAGETYLIAAKITTIPSAEVDERTIAIKVFER